MTELTTKQISIHEVGIVEKIKDKELRTAVAAVSSWISVYRIFRITRSYKAQCLLRDRASKLGISTNHFLGAGGKPRPITDYLGQTAIRSPKFVKQRLVEEGLIKNACGECGQGPEWNGKPLSFMLKHKNNNPADNRLENLHLICPNCHTQSFDPKNGHESRKKILRERRYTELALSGQINGETTGIEHRGEKV